MLPTLLQCCSGDQGPDAGSSLKRHDPRQPQTNDRDQKATRHCDFSDLPAMIITHIGAAFTSLLQWDTAATIPDTSASESATHAPQASSAQLRADHEIEVAPPKETPLYNALVGKLTGTGQQYLLQELVKLKHNTLHLAAHQSQNEPHQFATKMELLLNATQAQRREHIVRLKAKHDPRLDEEPEELLVLDETDMKEIFRLWQKDWETWSTAKPKITKLNYDRYAQHNQIRKAFSAMIYHLSGNSALVYLFVRFPICDHPEPASILHRLIGFWHQLESIDEVTEARQTGMRKEAPVTKAQQTKQKKATRFAGVGATIAAKMRKV